MFTGTGQDWMWGTCTAGHGEITVLCKSSEEEICRNQWILVNFDDQMAKLRFRQKSRQNFANKVINRNKILWHDEISCRAGWNFVSLKRGFAFLKRNFISAKQNIVSWKGNFVQDWVENCSIGQTCLFQEGLELCTSLEVPS